MKTIAGQMQINNSKLEQNLQNFTKKQSSGQTRPSSFQQYTMLMWKINNKIVREYICTFLGGGGVRPIRVKAGKIKS